MTTARERRALGAAISPGVRQPGEFVTPTSRARLLGGALLCLVLVGLLAVAGPALDEHSAARAQAAAQEDAQREASARQRFERAAQRICGPQAAWTMLADGVSIQCLTKRGAPTFLAQVRP